VAMLPDEFRSWLASRAKPSSGLDMDKAGASLFQERRCGTCHRIDGTEARGTSGPDLSHVGSRLAIGAGLLENTEDNIARFVSHAGLLKPGSRMPSYADLTAVERVELARWLKALQ
jgi:cytochrome c oxidase subunit 2